MLPVKRTKPLVLIIMDGWGIAPSSAGNAISLARTPNLNKFWVQYPHTVLTASGEAVGLPSMERGNSEVGHLNLGAGRIVYQDLPRINMNIADGSFFKNPSFLSACKHIKKNKSNLHLMGLIGPGGVHSSLGHLFALLDLAKIQKINRDQIKLHLFTDGRDAPPTSGLSFVAQIEEKIRQTDVGEIATISGRYYAMDRDNRWDRTERVYKALTKGEGEKFQDPTSAVSHSYKMQRTDEFILPSIIIDKNNKPVGLIKDNDAVIFFNFRSDRAVQLTKSFVEENLDSIKTREYHFDEKLPWPSEINTKVKTFNRGKPLDNLFFVSMTEYEKNLPVSAIAFNPSRVSHPLAAVISENNLRQLHVAETEKYYHVTYFLNGTRAEKYQGEDWLLVPSAKIQTYDLKPEMSAPEITKIVTNYIAKRIYDFIIVNLANGDMVGHTGVLEAAVKACEVVDESVGKIVQTTLSVGGACIITADHGNVEEMLNLVTGLPDTEHSINPVPCIIIKNGLQNLNLPMGILADIAPTALNLLDIHPPSIMTGRNLLN